MRELHRYGSLDEYLRDISRLAREYEHIYLYGAGIFSQEHYKKLHEIGVPIDGFVVTSKSENRDEAFGLPIKQLNEMELPAEKTLIIIGTKHDYQQQIIDHLQANGYTHFTDTGEDDWWLEDIEKERREHTAIEITTRIGCAVNCRYCPQGLLMQRYYRHDKQRKAMLSLEDFRICLERLPLDTIVTFSGFCEPFLNPVCADMILATVAHGNRVSLHTTLVGMTMRDFEKIKDVPFEYLTLHLPDKDGFANIPITNEYLAVLDKVLNSRKSDGTPWVTASNSQSHPPQRIIDFVRRRVTYTDIRLLDRAGSLEDEHVAENVYITGPV